MGINRLLLRCTGMSRLFKNNKTGVTMVEILIATFLLSVIFLAVSSLYLSSQKIYTAATEKIIIGYEVQYAIEHIYKNAMRAVGDETSSPGTSAIDVPSAERIDLRMHTIAAGSPTLADEPLTRGIYYSNITTFSYYKSGNTIMFSDGTNSESIIPKVIITAVNFAKTGNVLKGSITAACGTESLTFYFSCYPRLASFN